MIQKYIPLLFLILLHFESKTQTPSFFVIGAEQFSNTNIYTLLYDDETDILYAGTNRGLYSYTQNKFTPLVSNKKQIGNSFFQLKKDKTGRIFCANLAGQIFEIKNNRLNLFYQMPSKEVVLDFRYFFDKKNDLIINSKLQIRKITTQSDSILINLNRDEHIENSMQFLDGSIYFKLVNTSSYHTYNKGELSKTNFSEASFSSKNSLFQFGDIKYYNSFDTIKRLDKKPFKSDINIDSESSIYQLTRDEIAVRDSKLGFYYVKLENEKLKIRPSGFDNEFISTITQNANNTTFLGTFKEGIIVIPNKNIYKQKYNSHLTGIISSPNNEVYLSDRKGNIFKDNNGLEKYSHYEYNVDHLFFLKGKYFIDGVLIDNLMHKGINSDIFYVGNVKDIDEYPNEYIFLVSTNSIRLVVPDTSIKISPDFARKITNPLYTIPLDNRGQSVSYIKKDSCLYYSTNVNVYAKKWNTNETEVIKFNNERILGNVLIRHNNQLIIGTEKNGILYYENKHLKKQITTEHGLKSNTILELKITKNLLFILSTKGIQVYDIKNNVFIGLGEREGIMAEKVTNFALSDDKLWLLDKGGYYSYDLQQIQVNDSITLGKLYLDSILVNNHRINPVYANEYSFDENKIQFFFDYRDIESKSETTFTYQLQGVSNTWETLNSTTNTIAFSALSPGQYTFILKANYRGQSTLPVRYQFRILPPFWFQLWFVILSIILIVSLVSVFFIFKMRRNAKRIENRSKDQKMQTAIFESKLKAIRSQMNPHFIFNALNSIQALVLKKDAEKSYDYIEMFSDLVRKTLFFSEKNYIPIKEEVDFLRVYLNLETLRMKEEFTFNIENNLDEEILIPSLLIQPFLENAIHHGLLHRKGKKELLITFDCNKETGLCTIIDNGIGRVKAAEINKRQRYGHESFSLNAMKERLDILSEQNNATFDYKIEDLYTENGTATGTKIIVCFPFKYLY